MSSRISRLLVGALAAVLLAAPAAYALASATETVIHSFGGIANGEAPRAGLIADAAGAFYGTTRGGGGAGPNPAGTVFMLTPPAAGQTTWTRTVLHAFTGGSDGMAPDAALLADATGALYGTTTQGGPANAGTVFKLTPPAAGQTAWTETVLYRFKGGTDGGDPRAGLVSDASGALYGTTESGGPNNAGTVFKLAPPAPGNTAWTESVLYRFTSVPDGARPVAALIVDASGTLYGTTGGGGRHDSGTVFKLTPPAAGKTAWTETVLYRFMGGTDGAHPMAALMADASGALYGTTRWGAIGERGTVFRLTPPAAGQTAWTETVLYRFTGHPDGDGAHPYGALIADASGALYGTTEWGGKDLAGTVFKLTPPAAGQAAWVETVLHSFTSGADGAHPYAGLVADASGTLYGTASGGSAVGGTAFKLTPPAVGQTAWTGTVLYSFASTADGHGPWSGLVAGSNGALYGTTLSGGASNAGTVFELTPQEAGQTAWTETQLHSFGGGADGASLWAGVIADASGVLYGTTAVGGQAGAGTVFKLTPPPAGQTDWTKTELYSFSGRGGDGAGPGTLLADASGALYGTAQTVVFKVTPPAAGKTAWTESELQGVVSIGALTWGKDGALYGNTQSGGSFGQGSVFKLTPPAGGGAAWTESVVYSFDGAGGSLPSAVIADVSGALYGTTQYGGPSNLGTAFKLTPPAPGGTAWTETVLHGFAGGTDGATPQDALLADASGALYGTTTDGGTAGLGTVFKLTPPAPGQTAWTETVLHSFHGGSDGANPASATLIADASGTLFGTTFGGGAHGAGTVFKLTP